MLARPAFAVEVGIVLEARNRDVRTKGPALRCEAQCLHCAVAAPRQFPDSRILVQLDEDFEIENVEVTEDDGAETIEFDSLDDLLDHISGPDEN